MKKVKIMIKLLSTLIFICLIISILSKINYGTWNITSYPNRVDFFGRNYYCSVKYFEVLKGNKKPKYEVSSVFDKLIGKRFYITNPKKNDFDPSVVYLYTGDNKYLVFVLSGGP